MKNKRIRTAMIRAGINQTQLAEILDISLPKMSVILQYELSTKEQDQIVSVIKDWESRR